MEANEYREVDLVDKVSMRREVADKQGTLQLETANCTLRQALGDEMADEIRKHLGDGNAKVTVSADVGTSIEYGNKAGAFCSVQVTCDNSMEAVQSVHDIVQAWVEGQVTEDLTKMEKVRDYFMSGGPAALPPKPVVQTPPTKSRPDFRR